MPAPTESPTRKVLRRSNKPKTKRTKTRTPKTTMTTTADLTSSLQRSASQLKEEALKVGNTAANAARDQLINPAKEAASKAADYGQEVYAAGREALVKHAGQANEMAREHLDRGVAWAKANPLAAIGIAFVAGLVFAKSALSSSR